MENEVKQRSFDINPEYDDSTAYDESEAFQNGYLPPDWEERRAYVFARDEYTCSNCGAKGGPGMGAEGVELHAHHIVPFGDGGTNKVTNLKTVCQECHNSIHEQSDDEIFGKRLRRAFENGQIQVSPTQGKFSLRQRLRHRLHSNGGFYILEFFGVYLAFILVVPLLDLFLDFGVLSIGQIGLGARVFSLILWLLYSAFIYSGYAARNAIRFHAYAGIWALLMVITGASIPSGIAVIIVALLPLYPVLHAN